MKKIFLLFSNKQLFSEDNYVLVYNRSRPSLLSVLRPNSKLPFHIYNIIIILVTNNVWNFTSIGSTYQFINIYPDPPATLNCISCHMYFLNSIVCYFLSKYICIFITPETLYLKHPCLRLEIYFCD